MRPELLTITKNAIGAAESLLVELGLPFERRELELSWRAAGLEQRLRPSGERSDASGFAVALLRVETEVARMRQPPRGMALRELHRWMQESFAMAAPYRDFERGAFSLVSIQGLNPLHPEFALKNLPFVMLFQMVQAAMMASELTFLDRAASPSFTAKDPDLVRIEAALRERLGTGDGPSPWDEAFFQRGHQQVTAQYGFLFDLQVINSGPPMFLAIHGGRRADREVSSITIAEVRHPRWGRGLALGQAFELQRFGLDAEETAFWLNQVEFAAIPWGAGVGAWIAREDLADFQSFVPDALFHPDMLFSLVTESLLRGQAFTRWIRDYLDI
jgi:hypothetical protein